METVAEQRNEVTGSVSYGISGLRDDEGVNCIYPAVLLLEIKCNIDGSSGKSTDVL